MPSSDQITVTQYLIRRGNYPDVAHHRLRPAVSHRAADSQQRIPIRARSEDPALSLHRGRRSRAGAGVVPYYLPGTNPFLKEFGEKYNIPVEVTHGGAAAMYPELPRRAEAPALREGATRRP